MGPWICRPTCLLSAYESWRCLCPCDWILVCCRVEGSYYVPNGWPTVSFVMPEAIPAAKPRNLFCSDLSVSSGLAAAWLSIGTRRSVGRLAKRRFGHAFWHFWCALVDKWERDVDQFRWSFSSRDNYPKSHISRFAFWSVGLVPWFVMPFTWWLAAWHQCNHLDTRHWIEPRQQTKDGFCDPGLAALSSISCWNALACHGPSAGDYL